MSCIAVRHLNAGACMFKPFKSELCKLHYNSLKASGPKEWTLSQILMRQENEIRAINASDLAGDAIKEELDVLKIRHAAEHKRIKEILDNSPDTLIDIVFKEKVAWKAARRAREHEIRFARMQQEQLDRQAQWRLDGNLWIQIPPPVPLEFHEDNQNIHLAVTVNEVVKKTIEKVILSPVPADYRWNMQTLSKTPGEIIAECKLSIAAGKLLMEKYTSDDTIYDMVSGIYGKTLDSVWQYIKNSSDKEVLIKTLKTELEDNIGMCAQGNLTRLCNVLQGYLDDMPKPSVSEILGDLLPPLMTIMDLTVRREKALQIMRTHNVPDDQQEMWLEPLMT
jgi:hypothetical protein